MPNAGPPDHPELADVGRLARRLLNRAVQTARTEDQPNQLTRVLLGGEHPHPHPQKAQIP